MNYLSDVLTTLSMLKRPSKRSIGVGQLSLVEHALCPLASSTTENLIHSAGYRYSTSDRKRKTANVRVFAPLGLAPADELYLWGLLNLTISQRETDASLTATPHWCLKQMGMIDAKTRRGGRQYQRFSHAIKRLSVVNYLSDAFYDPARSEYRRVSFGFLSYSLPLNPKSSRAWTIQWDPVFFELIRAKGGSMRFDFELYRSFDPASRRLFLFVLKVAYRKGRLPVLDLRSLAVDLLGLSPTLATRDMKVKVQRTLRRLETANVISNPLVKRIKTGVFIVRYERGSYLNLTPKCLSQNLPADSPLMDGLLEIGFEDAAAARIIRRYPSRLVAQWTDVTQAALERFGKSHFRVSPMAYFVDSIKKAAEGIRTPPDWWHDAKRKERNETQTTESGKEIMAKLMVEVFGSGFAQQSESKGPEVVADVLKKLV